MNFKVVNGTDYTDIEDDFIKLYNDLDVRASEIPERLGITTSNYQRLRRHLHKEGRIELRQQMFKRTPKQKHDNHIFRIDFRKSRKPYYAVRYTGGEYCCSCISYEEAEEVVRRLEACNWDRTQVRRIHKEVREMIMND